MTTFTHHSPLSFDPARAYTQVETPAAKPSGLWLSVDDDWATWCRENDFKHDGLGSLTQVFEVDTSKVLWLRTPEDIDSFTQKYGAAKSHSAYGRYIAWWLVSLHYPGIIIAPYQWSRRLAEHTDWYYTWDCASGCVWDLSILTLTDTVTDQSERVS